MVLKDGIFYDVSNEDYHGDRKYVSSSGLKLMYYDPAEYFRKYVQGGKSEEISAFTLGTYIHALILEPETVEKTYVYWDGARRAGKEYEKFMQEHAGKIAITTSQKLIADSCVMGFRQHKKSGFIDNAKTEVTLCTKKFPVPVKVRADALVEDVDKVTVYDIKSTGDEVSVESFSKTAAKYHYDLSAALYVDSFAKVLGKPTEFCFVALNKNSGECMFYKASEQLLTNGRKKYEAAMKKLVEARKTGIYISDDIPELFLPQYALI